MPQLFGSKEGCLTTALLLVESALFLRLVLTAEVLRRPAFSIYLLVAIYSALTYSPTESREHYLAVALWSDIARAGMIIEAIWIIAHKRLFFYILAFGVAFGAMITALARMLLNNLMPVYGQQVSWHVLALFYLAGTFCFASGYVSVSEQAKRERAGTSLFDLTLGLYLWIEPVANPWSYLTPRWLDAAHRILNPDWLAIHDTAILLRIACMVCWFSTDRTLYYLKNEIVDEWICTRESYRDCWKNKGASLTHSGQSCPR